MLRVFFLYIKHASVNVVQHVFLWSIIPELNFFHGHVGLFLLRLTISHLLIALQWDLALT